MLVCFEFGALRIRHSSSETLEIGQSPDRRNRKKLDKGKGPDRCPGLCLCPTRPSYPGLRRDDYSSSSGCSSGGARPSRPFRSSSSVIRSTATSVSSASTLAPAEPINGTVSGSGSSTSTNFCRECTSSSRKSSGEIEESAISRSDTTGFLSLSRSTVSCEPDEIIRARCAASKTRSNRLSTLSMQSSTVTRAIDCRSVKWGPICWLLGLVIAADDVSQGKICDLPS